MAYINLLPWRLRIAQRAKHRRQQVVTVIGLLVLIVGSLSYLHLSQRLDQQTHGLGQQHQQLTNALHAQTNAFNEHQRLAQQLHAAQYHLLNEILHQLPAAVELVMLTRQDQQIRLHAEAPSQQLATPMLQSLQSLTSLSEVQLHQVFDNAQTAKAEFELTASLVATSAAYPHD